MKMTILMAAGFETFRLMAEGNELEALSATRRLRRHRQPGEAEPIPQLRPATERVHPVRHGVRPRRDAASSSRARTALSSPTIESQPEPETLLSFSPPTSQRAPGAISESTSERRPVIRCILDPSWPGHVFDRRSDPSFRVLRRVI
jgi:hypothetical protein